MERPFAVVVFELNFPLGGRFQSLGSVVTVVGREVAVDRRDLMTDVTIVASVDTSRMIVHVDAGVDAVARVRIADPVHVAQGAVIPRAVAGAALVEGTTGAGDRQPDRPELAEEKKIFLKVRESSNRLGNDDLFVGVRMCICLVCLLVALCTLNINKLS